MSEKEGNVRLTTGTATIMTSGRVEICHESEWGAVCKHGWKDTNTDIVCRQLGFSGGTSFRKTNTGAGPIWMHHVRCEGSESLLADCNHRGWDWQETEGLGSGHCNNEAVAVTCIGRCKIGKSSSVLLNRLGT